MRRAFVAIVAAVMLSGCTVLTAPAPLFTPGDQDGVFALEEGLWAYRDKDCATDPARSSPRRKSCLDWGRIVPRGERSGPVRRLVLIALDCGAITRDGDIPDITVRRSDGRIVGCTATTKDAVREAARRGVLAEAGRIGDEELVWVRK